MIYCECVFQKSFEHEVSKKAYLNACKWLAQNIYSNVELSKHVVVNIQKCANESPTFVVSVYVKHNENDVREGFCKHCKTLHTIFYSIDGVVCSQCKANAYFKQLDKEIEQKASFVNKVLEDK